MVSYCVANAEIRVRFSYGSPKIKNNIVQDYQQRAVDEKQELDDRLSKLTNFVGDKVFAKLDFVQQALLRIQLGVMQAYSEVLSSRINYFN